MYSTVFGETSNVNQCPENIAMCHAEMSIKFSDNTQLLAVESLMFPDQNRSKHIKTYQTSVFAAEIPCFHQFLLLKIRPSPPQHPSLGARRLRHGEDQGGRGHCRGGFLPFGPMTCHRLTIHHVLNGKIHICHISFGIMIINEVSMAYIIYFQWLAINLPSIMSHWLSLYHMIIYDNVV